MSLFSRLSVFFVLILIVMGGVIWLLAHEAQQRYFEEKTQALNRPITMFIAEQVPLFSNGNFNRKSLAELAAHVIIINPSLQLYLLDTQGRVVASAVDDALVLKKRVDLAPVHQFLSEQGRSTVYGDDPTSLDRKRIFSAYPVSDTGIGTPGCAPCGYVYAVVNVEQSNSIWHAFLGSQALQYATEILFAIILCAMLVTIALFFMLTRPLRSTAREIAQWQLATNEKGHESAQHALSTRHAGDELKLLENTCRDMAQRLTTQYKTLETADFQRRQLFTRLSHDLRTPLTSVCGVLETLGSASSAMPVDERQQYMKVASRQAYKLHRLIDQVFELARLDSGDVALELEPLSFQELTMDTVQELVPQAQAKGVKLCYTPINPELQPMVLGDIAQLNRVMVNLLSNAIRCTPRAGSVIASTRVNHRREIVVEIIDKGCGFANELCEAPLSSLDFTEDINIRAAHSGTGLGLGIVSRILELHGTQATVTSKPGVGTLVRFVLPGTTDAENLSRVA